MAVTARALATDTPELRVVEPSEPSGGDGFAAYIVGELGDEKTTAWTYEQGLCRLERFLGMSRWDIDAPDLRRFFRTSNYHPATKNTTIVGFRAFVRYGLLEGRISPEKAIRLLSLKAPKQRRRPKRPLAIEDVHTLLDACRTPNEFRLIYPGFYQGLRISDSARLEREWVLSDRLAFVSVKYKKYLELPLHAELERVLPKILERSSTYNTLKSTCQALALYTGIKFTSHRLRHTFARRHDDLGTQEGVAIELLGHEQVSVYRRHYAQVSWDAMVEAQAGLWY